MNNLENPLVSIIIPVYNAEKYLVETLNSVIEQTYKSIEIIIVDDGSTDNTLNIIHGISAPIRYYFQINSGTASARNLGVQAAKGSFFAFLDQDDLWTKDKLTLQISAFEKDSRIDIVFGQVKQFFSPEEDETFRKSKVCPPLETPGYLPSAMLIRKEAFFRVGEFESSWQIGEWADWYVRASELKLQIEMLPDLVALRRIHSHNKGIVQRQYKKEYLHILKDYLDRTRATTSRIIE